MTFFPAKNEKKTFEDVALLVEETKLVIGGMGINIGDGSALNKVFQDTFKVVSLWPGSKDKIRFSMLLNLLNADKICSAITALKDDPALRTPLSRIARSDMNLNGRAISKGKDALWELVLLSVIKKALIHAELKDPPDIILDMDFGKYSIACKKIYSESNVNKLLSIGAKQIVGSGNKGIVAFNIDELTPADSILQLAQGDASLRRLAKFNDEFIQRHHSQFLRYVKSKKIDGVLVSTSVPADLKTDSRRLNNLTQYTFWTPTDKTSGGDRLHKFAHRLNGK